MMIAARSVAAALLLASALLPGPPARAQLRELLGFEREPGKPWTGDLDGMVERRLVRMLVVPSRTFYFVRLSSSYFQSLWHLNESFGPRGLPPVVVKPAPEELEDEDILEMLNAGLVKLAVVDGHKAEFWARIFADIRLHPDVAVRTGSDIAFAFRKDSPKLRAALDGLARRHGKGTAFGNAKFRT
jgi:hypothetical protein